MELTFSPGWAQHPLHPCPCAGVGSGLCHPHPLPCPVCPGQTPPGVGSLGGEGHGMGHRDLHSHVKMPGTPSQARRGWEGPGIMNPPQSPVWLGWLTLGTSARLPAAPLSLKAAGDR